MKINLDREVLIDICRDGTISYRERSTKAKPLNGAALPVFSVDTVNEAIAIQVRFGAKQYGPHPNQPGRDWHVWPGMRAMGDSEALAFMHDTIMPSIAAFHHLHIKRDPPPEVHRDCKRIIVVRSSDAESVVYAYEKTAGTAPGRIRRNRGRKGASGNPVQMLAFEVWRQLFSMPALRRTGS